MKRLIFFRVTTLIVFMAIALGAVYSYYTIQRHREMTINMWKSRSRIIAEAVGHNILWDDRVAVRRMLMSELQGNDILLYSFVIKEGTPYVFTFGQGVPPALLQQKPPGAEQPLWEFQDQNGMVIYDIATAIDNAGTTLRIGLMRSAIDDKMYPLILSISMITLAILGAGIYLARIVALRTTREVDTLVDAIRTYGEVNDSTITLEKTSSEVSELIASFKHLTAMRKEAETELGILNSQLEQRVHERTARLRAMNKELDAFSYSVSHDLRAPLRAVEGFSHALMEDYSDRLDECGKDYLCRIQGGCVKMGKLIDALLKLSRITRSELKPVPVRIGQTAAEIALELQRGDPGRNVQFRIDTGLTANADPVMIRSVMENLMRNAWKFTRHTDKAVIEFDALDRDENQVYFVKDNGAGFNMEYKSRLFGAFQRLHRNDEFEGTGIGLATVQRIILLHGGKVWAEGEEGKGAAFYFTLGEAES